MDWPTVTFVLRFLDKVAVTFETSQFCTDVICKMPQVDKTSTIRITKKEIFCFGFLNSIAQATAQPNIKITKSQVYAGNT